MDYVNVFLIVVYVVAFLAIISIIYSIWSTNQIKKKLAEDHKKRITLSAWDYYHDRAKKFPKK